MSNLLDFSKKSQRALVEEIKLFIEYGVRSDEKAAAIDIVEEYSDNSTALSVLRDFYSRLPKLRDEAVKDIHRIVSRMGFVLLGVNTRKYEYLYFYNGEKSIYLGEKRDGIQDTEVLSFFGFSSNDELRRELAGIPKGPGERGLEQKAFCPACSVESGAFHQLGCPVEICPWCDSQLTYCNCRFERLGVDEIVDEADIDRFEILLNDKGRIRFSADQAPAYPDGGDKGDDPEDE